MAPHNERNHTPRGVFLALALASCFVLAGCSGFGGGTSNQAPQARLKADRNEGWTTDSFAFDARDSSDPDGKIASWVFDFGDGNQTSVTDREAADVKHTYGRGGDYHATVTVLDSGTSDGQNKKSDSTSLEVKVDEKMAIAGQVLYASPPGPLNATQTSRLAMPVEVRDKASTMVLHVDLRSVVFAGSSEIRLRILDPNKAVLKEQTVMLPAGQNQTVEIQAPLSSHGAYAIEIVANSGGCALAGEVRTYYG
ncbi:MAG: PKD domain-containing protein [bacterium]